MNLAGGRVLVTGAASGIGAAVATALADAGSVVAAFDRDARGLALLSEQLGARFEPCVVDLTDEATTRRRVAEAEERIGPLDGLVNAAGVLPLGNVSDPSASAADLRYALSVNVEGLWTITSEVARRMKERRAGAVVTVSSNAGRTPRVGMGFYAASKAAATMLTRCFALELAEFGVRCNVVSPGSTDTPMLRSMMTEPGSEARIIAGNPATHRLGIPLGRIARPDDVAGAVLFLLSDAARHITLCDLSVDGGATF